MKRFVEGLDRGQSTLFPASLDDYVTEDNPVRAVDVFVDGLDLDSSASPASSHVLRNSIRENRDGFRHHTNAKSSLSEFWLRAD